MRIIWRRIVDEPAVAIGAIVSLLTLGAAIASGVPADQWPAAFTPLAATLGVRAVVVPSWRENLPDASDAELDVDLAAVYSPETDPFIGTNDQGDASALNKTIDGGRRGVQ